MVSPIKATLPKVEREVGMTMDVRDLLSWMGLDMSGHLSENLTSKRLHTPLPHKLGDPSGPVDTSSQVSTLDDAEMVEASLEEIPTTPSPTAKTPGPSGSIPPTDAGHLWEEANKALKGTASYQVIHWCPSAEISLGAGHGSLLKQFQNNRIHQGSQAHLHPFYPGTWDPLLHNHQESQDHLHPFYPESWDPLLHNHQGS